MHSARFCSSRAYTLLPETLPPDALSPGYPSPHTLPPGKDIAPGTINTLPPEQIDRHLWKHYFPATTFSGGNNIKVYEEPWGFS